MYHSEGMHATITAFFFYINGWHEIWHVDFLFRIQCREGGNIEDPEIKCTSGTKNIFIIFFSLKQTSINENYDLNQYEADKC